MAVDPKADEAPPVELMLAGAAAVVLEPPTPAAAVNGSEAAALAADKLALEPVAAACVVPELPAVAGLAATEPAGAEPAAAEREVLELVAPEPEAPGFVAPEPARGGAANSMLVEPAVPGIELVALVRVTPVESPAGGFPVGELTPGASPTGLIVFLMPVAATSFEDVLGDGVLGEVATTGPDALEGVALLIGTPTGLEVPADAGIAR